MPKKNSKILKKAANLLFKYDWCKEALCLDKNNNKVPLSDPKLAQIDITAALWLANNLKWPMEAADIAGGISCELNHYHSWSGYYLVTFNDQQSLKDKIIQLLDAAYVLSLQEEGKEPEEEL